MAEVITCSECQRKLQVPESFLGQKVQCPECRHQFVAQTNPNAVQTPPPPPKPEESKGEERPRGRRKYEEDDEFEDDYCDRRPHRNSGIPHRGGIILAMGLLAWIMAPCSTLICGPIAWLMGNSDLARIRAGEMDASGEGMVQAGRILGMVGTLLSLVGAALFCLFFLLANA
jgi:DNA-directed RNA polymerase subunit RPC12/RpoP